MLQSQKVEIAHFDDYTHPLSGKHLTETTCGMCNAKLPLPGKYPLMVVRRELGNLYDLTNDPGSTDEDGKPRVIQCGFNLVHAVCWHHVS